MSLFTSLMKHTVTYVLSYKAQKSWYKIGQITVLSTNGHSKVFFSFPVLYIGLNFRDGCIHTKTVVE